MGSKKKKATKEPVQTNIGGSAVVEQAEAMIVENEKESLETSIDGKAATEQATQAAVAGKATLEVDLQDKANKLYRMKEEITKKMNLLKLNINNKKLDDVLEELKGAEVFIEEVILVLEQDLKDLSKNQEDPENKEVIQEQIELVNKDITIQQRDIENIKETRLKVLAEKQLLEEEIAKLMQDDPLSSYQSPEYIANAERLLGAIDSRIEEVESLLSFTLVGGNEGTMPVNTENNSTKEPYSEELGEQWELDWTPYRFFPAITTTNHTNQEEILERGQGGVGSFPDLDPMVSPTGDVQIETCS